MILAPLLNILQQETANPLDSVSWWIQIPVIAAFIWFVIQLSRHQSAQLDRAQEERKELLKAFAAERDARDVLWREWLAAQAEKNAAQATIQSQQVNALLETTWEKVDVLTQAVTIWDQNTCTMTEKLQEVLRQLSEVPPATAQHAPVEVVTPKRRRTTKKEGGETT